LRSRRHDAVEGGLQLRALCGDLRALLAIVLSDTAQKVAERRQAVAGFLRKVSAAEERLLFLRCEKHGQRPTA